MSDMAHPKDRLIPSDSHDVENTLHELDRLRSAAPAEVGRLEERIRFSLLRVHQLRRAEPACARPDRLDIASQILDEHARRARTFIIAFEGEGEDRRVA